MTKQDAVPFPKIAICLSGQMRKLKRTDMVNLAEFLNADVYIHTWDDQHNPNLSLVSTYFPGATVDVEKYSDTFDDLPFHLDESLVCNRYYYAQFYSTLKSFHLAGNSNIDYDLIYRARTDIKIDVNSYNFKERWNDLGESIKRIRPRRKDRPIVYTNLQYANSHYVDFEDSFWSMNKQALDTLCEQSPKEFTIQASTYKLKDSTIQSPSIWGSMLIEKGITLLTTGIGFGGPIKKNPDLRVEPGHGEIDD